MRCSSNSRFTRGSVGRREARVSPSLVTTATNPRAANFIQRKGLFWLAILEVHSPRSLGLISSNSEDGVRAGQSPEGVQHNPQLKGTINGCLSVQMHLTT